MCFDLEINFIKDIANIYKVFNIKKYDEIKNILLNIEIKYEYAPDFNMCHIIYIVNDKSYIKKFNQNYFKLIMDDINEYNIFIDANTLIYGGFKDFVISLHKLLIYFSKGDMIIDENILKNAYEFYINKPIYSNFKKVELIELCRKHNLKNYSSLKKHELMKFIDKYFQ